MDVRRVENLRRKEELGEVVVEGVGREGEGGEEAERFFLGSEAGMRGEEE